MKGRWEPPEWMWFDFCFTLNLYSLTLIHLAHQQPHFACVKGHSWIRWNEAIALLVSHVGDFWAFVFSLTHFTCLLPQTEKLTGNVINVMKFGREIPTVYQRKSNTCVERYEENCWWMQKEQHFHANLILHSLGKKPKTLYLPSCIQWYISGTRCVYQ